MATSDRARSGGAGLFYTVAPMLRALLWGSTGLMLGIGVTALLQGDRGFGELGITIGYVLALVGWVLGGGAWEGWVLPWFGVEATWDEGTGTARYWRYNTDHKVLGLQYLTSSGVALFIAGMAAMLMRVELATPQLNLFATNQWYNAAMGVHGTLMIFSVAVVAIIGGFGNYFIPISVGADNVPFPQLDAASWWFVVPGLLAVALSPLMGGIQAGWTGYAPLTAQAPPGQILYSLGIFTLGISSLLTALNMVGSILFTRAPGMTLFKMPMFAWGILATSVLGLLWLPVVGVVTIMGILDRLVPTGFFNAEGVPLLYQDLFWLFAHPEVYIIILPAWAIWLEILPVFSRKTLFGYGWAVAGFIGVTLLSSTVWTHHMFTTTADERAIPFMTTTELISIPTGLFFLVALATLWGGKIQLNTPMLFVLFSLFTFFIGGVSGVITSDVPADFMLHDTFFVVAHIHYVIIGGMIFAFLAALHYWFPKYSGRMYNERWGKISAWLQVVSFNLAFFPMHILGMMGMNRRIAEYPDYLGGMNMWVSVWAFIYGASFFIPLINLWVSWWRGEKAPVNPWDAKTLEWQTTSPPPKANFSKPPTLSWDMYAYGEGTPDTRDLYSRVNPKNKRGEE